jgi:structure-specific endonuclease subunit SLX1
MEARQGNTTESSTHVTQNIKQKSTPTKKSKEVRISNNNGPYYCYIIRSENKTYNGYTNNLRRRLRQHNGEIRGGARATHNRGVWSYLAIMTSPEWTAIRAMENEWSIKHPTRKRIRCSEFNGPTGRLWSLKLVFQYIPEPVTLYIHQQYLQLVFDLNLPSTVTIRNLNELVHI